ncbi:hypothetical protein THRCLA_11917 [Thraustotheca clavata]|uniref:Protein kinase domain-containing protein n=1 Tax=Thraustotheca clavata TaxID=74557 RepID=A0A1V9Y596_9STRA|nr:hypothetical protein THRCLA_11917 [Thraustotheca clavata]
MEMIQLCQSPFNVHAIAVAEDKEKPLIALNYGNPLIGLDIAWAIANALADLHRMGIMHRDVKSTLLWLAPEVLNGQKYSYSYDIYSFGIVLAALDTLQKPYYHIKGKVSNITQEIQDNQIRPKLSDNCNLWLKDLFIRCTTHEPNLRQQLKKSLKCFHNELRKL